MQFKDKFNITLTENLSFACNQIVKLIYQSAKLEGLLISLADIELIFDNRSVGGMSLFNFEINNNQEIKQFLYDNCIEGGKI
ncbi:MAG: hypothetical protein FWE36_08415 [Erysipelotrichales bacterium]|nr:hypothetical protein [Erysipelotrichales bacterium]